MKERGAGEHNVGEGVGGRLRGNLQGILLRVVYRGGVTVSVS